MKPTKTTEEIIANKTRPDCKKCEHEHNNYCDNFEHEVNEKGSEEVFCSEYNPKTTGSNDNNWHWKTIGQGEGIQKVESDLTSFERKWIAICIGIVVIDLIIAGCFTKKDLDNFGNNLPAFVPAIETKVCEVKKGIFTAYSPKERQTDSDPNINASGHRVQLGDIACPAIYPFGTKIEVLDKVYVCRDRMALKYRNSTDPLYFDIFLWNTDEARAWGRQELYFKIIK
jgi:hypothetical protein